jgi:hypothetical protein
MGNIRCQLWGAFHILAPALAAAAGLGCDVAASLVEEGDQLHVMDGRKLFEGRVL